MPLLKEPLSVSTSVGSNGRAGLAQPGFSQLASRDCQGTDPTSCQPNAHNPHLERRGHQGNSKTASCSCLLSMGSWKRGCSKARGVPWYSFSLRAKSTDAVDNDEANHLPQCLCSAAGATFLLCTQSKTPHTEGRGHPQTQHLFPSTKEFQLSRCWLCFCSPRTTFLPPEQPCRVPPPFPVHPITGQQRDLRSVLSGQVCHLRPAAEEGNESKATGEMLRALIPFSSHCHHFHDNSDARVVQGGMEVDSLRQERRENKDGRATPPAFGQPMAQPQCPPQLPDSGLWQTTSGTA